MSAGRCGRCGAAVQAGQEYCLECGARLEHARPGPVERASETVARRHPWTGAWVLPALLGLLIAIGGAAAAIAISGEGEDEAAIPVATGGSLTVTETASTLTALEPTTSATTDATAAPPPATSAAPATTAAPGPPPVPAAITWPRDRRGWTIVLLSLPQANGRDAAVKKAREARSGGLRRVGVLDSSRFASLHPGYYVVFQGVFDSEPEASSALQRARAVFPTAYPRQIVP